jgi:hypothetical protein
MISPETWQGSLYNMDPANIHEISGLDVANSAKCPGARHGCDHPLPNPLVAIPGAHLRLWSASSGDAVRWKRAKMRLVRVAALEARTVRSGGVPAGAPPLCLLWGGEEEVRNRC